MARRGRLAVRVTRDAERQLRAGHPWVYDRSIVSTSHEGQPGDLAVVFDRKRKFVAVGLWDPASPIRIKVLQHRTPATIDPDFWSSRLSEALAVRRPLATEPSITGYRLVNGESDAFPGLVADRYGDDGRDQDLLMRRGCHTSSPLRKRSLPQGNLTDIVLRTSRAVARVGPGDGRGRPARERTHRTGRVRRTRPHLRRRCGTRPKDRALPRPAGQPAGRVGRRAAGASVLDIFSCTGGFSLHAAAGGAVSVHSVDASRHAIADLRANIARNSERSPPSRRATSASGSATHSKSWRRWPPTGAPSTSW